jgi:hypothetical protein
MRFLLFSVYNVAKLMNSEYERLYSHVLGESTSFCLV